MSGAASPRSPRACCRRPRSSAMSIGEPGRRRPVGQPPGRPQRARGRPPGAAHPGLRDQRRPGRGAPAVGIGRAAVPPRAELRPRSRRCSSPRRPRRSRPTGLASPARVHALVEAGQAQVAAGATEAAIQVMRTACDEAARTGNPALEATAQLALGAALIDAGTARHHRTASSRCTGPSTWPEASGQPADRRLGIPAPGRLRRAARLLQPSRPPARRSRSHHGPRPEPSTSNSPPSAASASSIKAIPPGRSPCSRAGLAADPDRAHPFLPIMLAHAGRAHLLAGDLPAARTHLEDVPADRPGPRLGRRHRGPARAARTRRHRRREPGRRAMNCSSRPSRAPARSPTLAGRPGPRTASACVRPPSATETSALSHLADAITRSRPQRGGHLWSHVWALTQAVPLARRADDPRAPILARRSADNRPAIRNAVTGR